MRRSAPRDRSLAWVRVRALLVLCGHYYLQLRMCDDRRVVKGPIRGAPRFEQKTKRGAHRGRAALFVWTAFKPAARH